MAKWLYLLSWIIKYNLFKKCLQGCMQNFISIWLFQPSLHAISMIIFIWKLKSYPNLTKMKIAVGKRNFVSSFGATFWTDFFFTYFNLINMNIFGAFGHFINNYYMKQDFCVMKLCVCVWILNIQPISTGSFKSWAILGTSSVWGGGF